MSVVRSPRGFLLPPLGGARAHGLGLERSVAHVEIGLEPLLPLRLEQLLAERVVGSVRERAQRAFEQQPRMDTRRLQPHHGDGLVEPHRRLRHQRDALRHGTRALHQLGMRHHLVDHADAQRLLGIEVVAGQRPAVGGLPAAQRAEQEGGVGDVAHFRLREHRFLGRDRDVGRELVPEAAAHGPAVDRRDDRLAEPPHVHPERDPVTVAALPILDVVGDRLALRVGMARAGLRVALVVAGREGAAGAGEDDHPYRAVGVGLVEGAVELRLELVGERIHALGAVEGDGGDALAHLVKQILMAILGHSSSLRCYRGSPHLS